MDVDLALDHRSLTEVGYKEIRDLLLSAGYEEGSQPFIYFRRVGLGQRESTVEVDPPRAKLLSEAELRTPALTC